MNPRRLTRLLAAAVLAAALPACNTQGPAAANAKAKPKVAFVTNNPETFWTIAEAGTRKAEKEFDVEVVFRKPDAGDAARQTEILDTLVNQDIKALAVSVIDPKGQRDHLKELAQKVPLLTQDNDAPDSGRLCYIGTDNYKAGCAVGQLVKEALPEGGVLAIFVGQTEPLNARQRRQGLLDELAGNAPPADINDIPYGPDGQTYGKFRLHRTYTDQPIGSQKATENASDALTALRDEKHLVMVGLWAYNPPAILTAVKDKGKAGQVKIVGFDENDDTLQGIADGYVEGTVVQNPFQFGYEAVRLMASLARGDRTVLPKGGVNYVPHRVITKAGGKDRVAVDAFRKELNDLLGKK